MAPKKVTLVHKDLPDQPATVGVRHAEILKENGWKVAPKSQQTDTPKP